MSLLSKKDNFKVHLLMEINKELAIRGLSPLPPSAITELEMFSYTFLISLTNLFSPSVSGRCTPILYMGGGVGGVAGERASEENTRPNWSLNWWDKVAYAKGLSYLSVRLHRLAGCHPYDIVDLSPSKGL
jgi:hypothetical protein